MEAQKLDEAIFDDCWIHIFKRFPLEKRIILEGVSQKWKTLMPYSDITSLNLAQDFLWPNNKFIQKQYVPNNFGASKTLDCVDIDVLQQTLETVLNRCGPYLQELNFQFKEGQKNHLFRLFVYNFKASPEIPKRILLTNDVVSLLIQKAPNLLKLNLSRCLLSLSCFPTLLNLKKLEELDLGQVLIFEDDLTSLYQNQVEMQSMVAATVQNLPTLKKLSLMGWMEVSPGILGQSLTELVMVAKNMTVEDVTAVVRNCPNLEALDLWFKPFVSLELGRLSRLHKLKKLKLQCGMLYSQEVDAICRGCPNLEELFLVSVNNLNSCPGLLRLKYLKCLNAFSISSAEAPVNDAILISLAQNGLLEAVGIPFGDLTDEGLSRLAHYCPNLVHLSVRGIRSISVEGMKVVLESCNKLETLELTDSSCDADPLMALIGAKGTSLMNLQAMMVTADGLKMLFEERQKLMKMGEVLSPLMVSTSVGCLMPISKEDLDTVNLTIN